MNNGNLISVVMSVYNHGQFVQDTIRSLISQTYLDIELIMVNDGSTDQTHQQIEAILPECRERFLRTEYTKRQNKGLVRSLNECLAQCRGDYVYIIASDDLAHPRAFETLHAFLAGHEDYGLAVGDNAIIDEEGRQCYWTRKHAIVYDPKNAEFLTHADCLRASRQDIDFEGSSFGTYTSLLSGNYVPNGYLIRKTIIDRFGGYSETAPLEDWHLMLQIAKYAKLKYIDEVLFSYRWHSANTIKQRDRMARYYSETLREEIPYAKAHGYGRWIPIEISLAAMGFKYFHFSRSASKTVLRVLGITLYKRKKRAIMPKHQGKT